MTIYMWNIRIWIPWGFKYRNFIRLFGVGQSHIIKKYGMSKSTLGSNLNPSRFSISFENTPTILFQKTYTFYSGYKKNQLFSYIFRNVFILCIRLNRNLRNINKKISYVDLKFIFVTLFYNIHFYIISIYRYLVVGTNLYTFQAFL